MKHFHLKSKPQLEVPIIDTYVQFLPISVT